MKLSTRNNIAPTLHDRAYERLKSALMTSAFPPGHKVTIRGCADALGMSTTPIRTAINRLVTEGALEMPSSRTVRVPIPTIEHLQEVTQLRLLMEPMATKAAVLRIDESTLQKLENNQIQMASAAARSDFKEYLALNGAFHFTLYEASQMLVLCRIIETLWQQVGPYLYLLEPSMRGIEFHAEALRAIRSGNADAAAAAIHSDIRRAADHLMAMLAKEPAAATTEPADT